MLVLLSVLASDLDAATMLRIAAERSQPCAEAECRDPEDRQSHYRVAGSTGPGYDRKAAALAITGRDCERIGKLFCTAKGRTVYTAAY